MRVPAAVATHRCAKQLLPRSHWMRQALLPCTEWTEVSFILESFRCSTREDNARSDARCQSAIFYVAIQLAMDHFPWQFHEVTKAGQPTIFAEPCVWYTSPSLLNFLFFCTAYNRSKLNTSDVCSHIKICLATFSGTARWMARKMGPHVLHLKLLIDCDVRLVQCGI